MMRTDQLKRNTLRSTADQFITGTNGYKTFLADVEELPRLSILDNYKRIKQIMNANYVKGISVEKKYRNRTKQDLEADEEYAKWRDEETNSKKMSTILRSLNTTNYKKKLPVAASAQPKTKIRQHELNQNGGVRASAPHMRANSTVNKNLKAIDEEEIY